MSEPGAPRFAARARLACRDFNTMLIYADYAPSAREAEWVEAAFGPGTARTNAQR